MNTGTVKTYFEVVVEIYVEHKYTSDHIYNTDESRSTVGQSQSSRALIDVREKSSWMTISVRQVCTLYQIGASR